MTRPRPRSRAPEPSPGVKRVLERRAEQRLWWEERAAVFEFEGGYTRAEAERMADIATYGDRGSGGQEGRQKSIFELPRG